MKKYSIATTMRAAALALLTIPPAGHAMSAAEIMKNVDDVNRKASTTAIVIAPASRHMRANSHGGAEPVCSGSWAS